MCICIHTCTYIYIYTYVLVSGYTYLYIYLYIHICLGVWIYIRTCIYIYIYIYVWVSGYLINASKRRNPSGLNFCMAITLLDPMVKVYWPLNSEGLWIVKAKKFHYFSPRKICIYGKSGLKVKVYLNCLKFNSFSDLCSTFLSI